MTQVKRYVQLLNSSLEVTGNWVQLDSRYAKDQARSLIVSIDAVGDTVTLQGVVKDIKGIDKSFLNTLASEDIATLKIYTQSEHDVLEGPWSFIRAIKQGTAGLAVVEGMV